MTDWLFNQFLLNLECELFFYVTNSQNPKQENFPSLPFIICIKLTRGGAQQMKTASVT